MVHLLVPDECAVAIIGGLRLDGPTREWKSSMQHWQHLSSPQASAAQTQSSPVGKSPSCNETTINSEECAEHDDTMRRQPDVRKQPLAALLTSTRDTVSHAPSCTARAQFGFPPTPNQRCSALHRLSQSCAIVRAYITRECRINMHFAAVLFAAL